MNTDSKVVAFDSHPERGGHFDQGKAQKIFDAIKTACLNYSKKLLQDMFDNADDTLFEMAEKADNNADQAIYFDSMRIVRLKRKEIEKCYHENIDHSFTRFWEGKAGARSEHSQDSELSFDEISFDELSLMEEVDLEESLAITTLVDKIKNQNAQDVSAIEKRLTHIAPNLTVEDKSNPLAPHNVCHAFQDATSNLDTDIKIKLIIYKLFDLHITNSISALYQEINAQFIEAGVLPKLKSTLHKSTPKTNTAQPQSSQAHTQTAGSQQFDTQGDGEVLVPLQQLLAQINNGMANADPNSLSSHTAAVPNGLIPSSSEQVLHALPSIQNVEFAASRNSNPQAIGAQFKSMLINQVTENAGHPMHINTIDSGVIDVVSMLFEFILDDSHLPITAKMHIARLQIPMLKVAVIDKAFFNSKGHPARTLLNTLARAGLGLDESALESDNSILAKIKDTVERVLNEFENDIDLFAELLHEFNAFIEQERQRESTEQESVLQVFHKKEEAALAKAWVDETLEQTLMDKNLPDTVEKIITGPWRDVMLHTYLNEGENSSLWKNQLRFVDVLSWSVEPKKLSLDRKKLGNIIKHLISTLRQGLKKIDYPTDKTEHLFEALQAYHLAGLHGLLPQEHHSEHADTATATDKALIAGPEQQEADASFFLFEETNRENADITSGENTEGFLFPQEQPAATPVSTEDETAGSDTLSNDVEQAIEQMEEQVASLSELEAMLNSVLEDAEHNPNDKLIMEDIVLSDWDADNIDPDECPDDEYLAVARHLEAGKWVEFADDGGNRQRAKLAWKSELLGEYTFLNWKFDVVADKTLFGLAADLRHGRAKVIDDVPIIDRAMTAVLSGFKRSAQ